MNTDPFKEELKTKAKERLKNMPLDFKSMDTRSIHQLVEDLQIHQVELEIQNEELRNAQLNLEASKIRYVSLFNNAPNGYVILNNAGIITEFNSTFEKMTAKRHLNSSPLAFADMLVEEDAKMFRGRFQTLFKQPAGKQFEYRLVDADKQLRHIQVTAKSHTNNFYKTDSNRDELLLMITDITELKQTKQELEHSFQASRAREQEVQALLKGARAVLKQTDFETTARSIFDICSEIIGSTSGYVALLSDQGDENEVLFLEAGGLPCTVDPELPMPIRGLRETAYRTNRTVYDNDFMNSEWIKYMPKGHVRLQNVMFAPLVLDDKTVGVMGLANKAGDFTETDAMIAHGFGKLCAIALQNSQNLDRRDAAEKESKKLISELKEALKNVKQLSGLLPICGHCKKIRDDKGYWKQLEIYIEDHSEAIFSHGVCRECAIKHYPDYVIYDE